MMNPILRVVLVFLLLLCPLATFGQAEQREEQTYRAAYEALSKEQWENATGLFHIFLERYPNSTYSDDARYWQCYVGERQRGAKEDVLACYKNFRDAYPRSEWVKDAQAAVVRLSKKLVDQGLTSYRNELEKLSEAQDEEVAMAALYALAQVGDASSLEAIFRLYERSASPRVREQAVMVMQRIRGPEVVEKLVQVIDRDREAQVRIAAIHGLYAQDTPRAIEKLRQVIRNEQEIPQARTHAIQALWMKDGQRHEDLVPVLSRLARHSDRELAEVAAHALGRMNTSAAARQALLGAVAERNLLPSVRQTALWSLIQSETQPTPSVLLNVALEWQDDLELRRVAVQGLARLRDGGGQPGLRTVLQQVQESVLQEDALHVIHTLRAGTAFVTDIETLLRRGVPQSVREAAVFALAVEGNNAAVPVLKKLALEDESVQVRARAVEALGIVKTPQAQRALVEILEQQ